jgi:hypothetical protein
MKASDERRLRAYNTVGSIYSQLEWEIVIA